jgi:23S rRNA (uracil1939-C5)-methyltransferase
VREQELAITIDGLDDAGRGVGAGPDGRTLHVAGALPGERVRVAVEHASPHAPRAWGRALAVLGAPSPDRVAPACPAYGRCGGCELQHLAYPAQLAYKHGRVAAALAAVPGAPAPAPVEPSPRVLGYRNRSKYVLVARGGRLVRASFEPASHEPVNMAGCRVPEPPLDEVAAVLAATLEIAGLPAYDEQRHDGELRHLVVRADHEGRVLALVVTRSDAGRDALVAAAENARRARPELAGVVRQVNPARGGAILGGREEVLAGAGTLVDVIGDVTLRLGAASFFQVNRAQAAALYAHAAAEAGAAPGARVVDLYCGAGGIALTAARRGARVAGVEAQAAAVADATASAALSGLAAHASFLAGDAADGLPAAAAALGGVDALIVDPPRKGLSPAARRAIAALAPPRLVYVSCAPESLARDLVELAAHGYRAERARPFDLMPGTPHVETVVTLWR